MRKLVALVILAAAGWGGYWFFAAHMLESRLAEFVATQRAAGWRVAYDRLNVQGFPNRLDTRAEGLILSPPGGKLTWRAPVFEVNTLSYRPNHVIAVWPPVQTLATPGLDLTLKSAAMRASAVIRPVPSLPLDRANMVIELPELAAPSWTLAADRALFAIRALPGASARYEIGADLRGVRMPDTVAGDRLQLRAAFHLEATLILDRPIDRHMLTGAFPAPTEIELQAFHGEWNGVEVRAEGTITLDRAGRPSGALTVRIRKWRTALEQARVAGMITADQAGRIASALGLMAGAEALTVPLIFEAGQTRLGPVPLGSAPLFRLNQRQ